MLFSCCKRTNYSPLIDGQLSLANKLSRLFPNVGKSWEDELSIMDGIKKARLETIIDKAIPAAEAKKVTRFIRDGKADDGEGGYHAPTISFLFYVVSALSALLDAAFIFDVHDESLDNHRATFIACLSLLTLITAPLGYAIHSKTAAAAYTNEIANMFRLDIQNLGEHSSSLLVA